MDRYRHPKMRELKDQQVRFAPLDRRLEQIQRAESLLAEIDENKKYPYPFVCYRITGFRPHDEQDVMLEGRTLMHDLRVFIEHLSGSTSVEALAAGEPVLTVEDLSRKLHVSPKTITRWRDRGLVSRRFVVAGRSRVGFLKSSVDRFVAQHGAEVDRGSRFSQLSDEEKGEIVERARRMVQWTGRKPAEIVRRIARKMGRSPETVRYTLKNYDRENPARPVFGRTSSPLRDGDKAAIYQAHRRGLSVDVLARRYGKTKTSIYRVINEQRARRILEQKLEFMPSPEFEAADATQVILGAMPESGTARNTTRIPKGLPSYLASLYEIPLLTKEQELHLFRKMNYLKYRAHRYRENLDPGSARGAALDEIERLQEEALAVKNQIIRANLRLVVSIAKKHVGSSNNFFELVSDGNMSLIRAVEKFDYMRGNKFSTYASWAIMKNFARSIPEEQHQHNRYVTGHEAMFESAPDLRSDERRYESEVKQIRTSLSRILDKLDERERSIIVSRFGLDEQTEPHTLEEVGNELGVTKERVRQLEVRALGKLRQYADQEHIELPGDE